jgi:hypothetical protein
MPPTSVRLTPAQEAELAALALDLSGARPELADAARGGALTPGAVLRLALARGLRELRGDLAAPAPAPPVLDPGPPAPAAPEPPRGLVLTVLWEARGTAYRLTMWRAPSGSVGAAWPEGRRGGWAWGDLSPHAPPEPGWLAESGLPLADAQAVAAALASRWGALTGAPVPHAPPAGALPGQALLPAYREPLR